MDDEELAAKAMEEVLANMKEAAMRAKRGKFAPKKSVTVEKIEMSPTEGGATLDGIMHKKGMSGKDMVNESKATDPEMMKPMLGMSPDAGTPLTSPGADLSEEDLMSMLAGAK